jgi:hypothetical protein
MTWALVRQLYERKESLIPSVVHRKNWDVNWVEEGHCERLTSLLVDEVTTRRQVCSALLTALVSLSEVRSASTPEG